ncbi:hypothetical protein P7K49_030969, partial [Saguinus oedipus]
MSLGLVPGIASAQDGRPAQPAWASEGTGELGWYCLRILYGVQTMLATPGLRTPLLLMQAHDWGVMPHGELQLLPTQAGWAGFPEEEEPVRGLEE